MTPDSLLKYLLDDYVRWHPEEAETPYEDPDERYNSSKRHVR